MFRVLPNYKSGYARSASESTNLEMRKGLVGAYYPSFGATGLILRDVSGSELPGTLTLMDPATDWDMAQQNAKAPGLSIDYDGFTDHVTLLQPAAFDFQPDADEFTISTWINTLFEGTILSKGRSSGGGRQYQIYLHLDETARSIVGGTQLNTSVLVGDGTWHNVVLRNYNDAGTLKAVLFINGVEVSPIITSGSATLADTDILLGARRGANNTDTGYLFNGKIGPVLIYNRAISSAEIWDLFEDPLAPFHLKPFVVGKAAVASPITVNNLFISQAINRAATF